MNKDMFNANNFDCFMKDYMDELQQIPRLNRFADEAILTKHRFFVNDGNGGKLWSYSGWTGVNPDESFGMPTRRTVFRKDSKETRVMGNCGQKSALAGINITDSWKLGNKSMFICLCFLPKSFIKFHCFMNRLGARQCERKSTS